MVRRIDVTGHLLAVLATDPVLTTNLTLLPWNGTSMQPWVRVTVAPCAPRSPRALCLSRETKAQALSSLLNVSVAANSRRTNAKDDTINPPPVVVSVSLGTRRIAPRPLPPRGQGAKNAFIWMLRDALTGNRMFRGIRDHTVTGIPERMFVYVVFAPVVIQVQTFWSFLSYTKMSTPMAHDVFDYTFCIYDMPGPFRTSSDYMP